VHLQASFAVAVKDRATIARIAKRIFFICMISFEVSFQFPSANEGGSQRHVSPQARGGGTGGREVRTEAVSSVSCTRGKLPGAKMARGCPAGIMTDGAAGTWQERGGQGQAVAQQSGSVWQHLAAHSATGAGCTAAGASGTAKEASRANRTTAFIGVNLRLEFRGVNWGAACGRRSMGKVDCAVPAP
jgi:hypothetical protein